MDTIEYKATTDPKQIEQWCKLALHYKLHSGRYGMFQGWFADPRNFKGLAVVFNGSEPIGIAIWLSNRFDADEFASVNTGCWIKPAYRRLGLGSELINQIKCIADEPILGFTGLYNQAKFWVAVDADARDIPGILEYAEELDITPADLGYNHLPGNKDEQHA